MSHLSLALPAVRSGRPANPETKHKDAAPARNVG
jgi:hypothetical protein